MGAPCGVTVTTGSLVDFSAGDEQPAAAIANAAAAVTQIARATVVVNTEVPVNIEVLVTTAVAPRTDKTLDEVVVEPQDWYPVPAAFNQHTPWPAPWRAACCGWSTVLP